MSTVEIAFIGLVAVLFIGFAFFKIKSTKKGE
jgi:hypothetical protein